MKSSTQYTRKNGTAVMRFTVFLWTLGVMHLLSVVGSHALGQTRELVEQFSADENSLKFKYRIPLSQSTEDRFKEFYSLWRTRISQVEFDSLDQDGKIDLILLKNHIEFQSQRGIVHARKLASVRRLAPYWKSISVLLEDHEAMKEIDPEKIAEVFTAITKQINAGALLDPLETHGRFANNG